AEEDAGEQAARERAVAGEEGDAASAGPEPHQDRGAGRAQRRLPERRDLGQRRLRRDLVQAPEEAAEDEDDDGNGVEVRVALAGARMDRIAPSLLRSPPLLRKGGFRIAPSPLRSPPSEREGGTPLESLCAVQAQGGFGEERREHAGDEAGGVRERRGGDVPAARVAQRGTPRRLA